jgi:hypothetical protein
VVIREPEARSSSTTCSTRTEPGTAWFAGAFCFAGTFWFAAVVATQEEYPLVPTAIYCVQLALCEEWAWQFLR